MIHTVVHIERDHWRGVFRLHDPRRLDGRFVDHLLGRDLHFLQRRLEVLRHWLAVEILGGARLPELRIGCLRDRLLRGDFGRDAALTARLSHAQPLWLDSGTHRLRLRLCHAGPHLLRRLLRTGGGDGASLRLFGLDRSLEEKCRDRQSDPAVGHARPLQLTLAPLHVLEVVRDNAPRTRANSDGASVIAEGDARQCLCAGQRHLRATRHVCVRINLLHHLALRDIEEMDLVIHSTRREQQVVDLGEGDAGARLVLMSSEDEFLGRDTDLVFRLGEHLRSVPDYNLAVPVSGRKHISLDDTEAHLSDLATACRLVGERNLRLVRIYYVSDKYVAVHVAGSDKHVICVEGDASGGEIWLYKNLLELLPYHVENHKVAAELGLDFARGLSTLRCNEGDLRAVRRGEGSGEDPRRAGDVSGTSHCVLRKERVLPGDLDAVGGANEEDLTTVVGLRHANNLVCEDCGQSLMHLLLWL